MSLENTVRKAAKLSGDLGIRTLDLQANIAALAERVVEQAETVERIGTDADRLERDQQNVSVAAREAKEKASAAHDVIDDSTRRLSVANANVVQAAGEALARAAKTTHAKRNKPADDNERVLRSHLAKTDLGPSGAVVGSTRG